MAAWYSPREALGYYYAHHQGPALARPPLSPGRSSNRNHWDASLVGALLRGPVEKGYLGIAQGSDLDEELRRWAITKGYARTPEIRRVEIRLRQLMRSHGIKRERPRLSPTVRLEFTDVNTGDQISTLAEVDLIDSAKNRYGLGKLGVVSTEAEIASSSSAGPEQNPSSEGGEMPDLFSSVSVDGALWRRYKTVSAAYTALKTDNVILADAGGGAFSITLPPLAEVKTVQTQANVAFTLTIVRISAAANNVTIDGDGTEEINGATTLVLTTQYQNVVLIAGEDEAGNDEWIAISGP